MQLSAPRAAWPTPIIAMLGAVLCVAASAQDFRALARQDLQRSHDELAANHPAPAVQGTASQGFRAWLDSGLQEALGLSSRVNSGAPA